LRDTNADADHDPNADPECHSNIFAPSVAHQIGGPRYPNRDADAERDANLWVWFGELFGELR